MTKIIMIWWVMSGAGEMSQPVEWGGWKSMEECETAAESFTEANPKEQNTYKFAVIASCQEIPK